MDKHKSKEITRADVAALAGVSGMTVSRVLNNSPLVTEDTRRAVLEACRKLKYRPNAFASGLRNKKSLSIGVAVPTFKHTFYGRMLAALETIKLITGAGEPLTVRPIITLFPCSWTPGT